VLSSALTFLLLCFASTGRAADPDTAFCRLTHAQFIDRSLAELADEILADMPAIKRGAVVLSPFDGQSIHLRLEAAFRSSAPDSGTPVPLLHYQVYRDEFSLVKKTRLKPLGSFWVLRTFDFGVTIYYPPDRTASGQTRVDFDRTDTGWVRAGDLAALAGAEFGGLRPPPASDFVSRWVAPAAVAGCLGALTYLFFSVR
jgi:hypothetical protein